MPTNMYKTIVESKPVPRGDKSKAFRVPQDLHDGPNDSVTITIQMAFVRPDWTLIFADHNSMITFHLMRLRRPFTASEFRPGSKVCVSTYCAHDRFINIVFI